MSINEQLLQQKIRSIFFESMTNESLYTETELLSDVARSIKEELGATYSAVYKHDKERGLFTLKTNSLNETAVLKHTIAPKQPQPGEKHVQAVDCFNENISTDEEIHSAAYLIPMRKKEDLAGYLFLAFKEIHRESEWEIAAGNITSDLYYIVDRYKNIVSQDKKIEEYKLLYDATAKFHSYMETELILREAVSTVKREYPSFESFLYLIQDVENLEGLPVKELPYGGNSESEASIQALITEQVQYKNNTETRESSIYAPLKGNQGVYGILQVTAGNVETFPEEEVAFLTRLADVAGDAIENAELYQQSRQKIIDLELVNKTSQTLNSNLRLQETTSFMNKQIKETFKTEEIGFILFKEEASEFEVLQGSSDFFYTKSSADFLNTIVKKLNKQKKTLFYGEFADGFPYLNTPFQSVIVAPMIQSNQIKGMILLLHKERYYFTLQSSKLIQSLAHHSTLAFVNSMLRDKLEALVNTDYLSGLFSRNYLDSQLEIHLQQDELGVFLLIDIDNFKKINDTFGHETGDELIVQVSNIIKSAISTGDFAARWGGEELAVYLPNATEQEGLDTAQQLVRQVEALTEPSVTVSIGVASWTKTSSRNHRAIFQRADMALYKAKRSGKNCVAK